MCGVPLFPSPNNAAHQTFETVCLIMTHTCKNAARDKMDGRSDGGRSIDGNERKEKEMVEIEEMEGKYGKRNRNNESRVV